MQYPCVDANGACMRGIKAKQHQIPTKHQQRHQDQKRNQQGLNDVGRVDTEHISKQDVREINIAACFRHQN